MNDFSNICILIPSFNPDGNLPKLIKEISQYKWNKIIVVDDGSSLATKKIFHDISKNFEITVLSHEVNKGKGEALKTGIEYIKHHVNTSHGFVTVDADGQHLVKDIVGRKFSVSSIGPAGENLVRFASIANDGGRQAGRTGVGAVMGSKNIKAIAIHGTHKIKIHDRTSLNGIREKLQAKSLGPATEKYRTLGTISNLSVFNRLDILPSYNFQQTKFNNIEPITAEQTELTHKLGSAHCASCTIGCVTLSSSGIAQNRLPREAFVQVQQAVELEGCGIDPETNLAGTSNVRGLDYFGNPQARSILITITMNM